MLPGTMSFTPLSEVARLTGGLRSFLTFLGCLALGAGSAGSGAASPAVTHAAGTLTLPTYAWYDDVNPVFREYEGAVYYPYTRQDHIAKSAHPRTYRTLQLENEHLRVLCIPELGGRIHSVLVKATGEEMFHRNDEIKPALIAMRGAWIGGGIEWNPGPQGHTVTILSPVDALVRENHDGSATLVVGNTEKMFRTRWTVELTLHPGQSVLDETIRIYNPTDSIAPYYFWNCTAFPSLEGTRFVYPMRLGTDHDGRHFFSWPVHEGRDLTWLVNYDTMTSIFAYQCAFDFFGAYDAFRDRGIVSCANHRELPGKKAWTWGKDDFGVVSQTALSDAGPVHAQYIEVQTGPLLTQSDYGMLKPGREVRWREFWYPVHGLGDGFEFATRHAAVQTRREKGGLEVRALATAHHPSARCLISRAGRVLLDETVDLGPARAVAVRLESAPSDPVEITLASAAGSVLLHYRSPLEIPEVHPPDLSERPARTDGRLTPDELHARAFTHHSQIQPAAAETGYRAALEQDPLHAAALCGLATLALDRADWTTARDLTARALERDANHGEAWYLHGVALLHLDELAAARTAGYRAAFSRDGWPRGYQLAGRAALRLGETAAAREAFQHALELSPRDVRNRNSLFAAALADNQFAGVRADAAAALELDPADFTLRALMALAENEATGFAAGLARDGGEVAFTLQETAWFLIDLGLHDQAARLLDAALGPEPIIDDPLSRVVAAYAHHRARREPAARTHLERGETLSTDYVFPGRNEDLQALEYAVSQRPDVAPYRLLLGQALARVGRLEAAVEQWTRGIELDPGLSVAWRLLALHAWRKAGQLDQANRHLERAIAARPNDQVLYYDRAQVLEALGRRPEAIALLEAMPRTRDVRYDIYLWLARAYLNERRHDDCITLLTHARFSNWEGQTTPHDLFVAALTARGRTAFNTGDFASARADFERALTYPENLEVGARYELTDAELRHWLGRTWLALGQREKARQAWLIGARQRTSQDPPRSFIHITPAQDDHVRKCREALWQLADGT